MTNDDTRGTCRVSDTSCKNPAGYGVGGLGAASTEDARTRKRCGYCGEFVCLACSVIVMGERFCSDHKLHEQETFRRSLIAQRALAKMAYPTDGPGRWLRLN